MNKQDYKFALVRLLSYAWTAKNLCATKTTMLQTLTAGLKNLEDNIGEKEYINLLAEEGVFRKKK